MLRSCLRHCPRATVRSVSCPRCLHREIPQSPLARQQNPISLTPHIRRLQTSSTYSQDRVPIRKQLKQDAKAVKSRKRERREQEEASRQKWELTVGVEIHAQLNTETKLFSSTAFHL